MKNTVHFSKLYKKNEYYGIILFIIIFFGFAYWFNSKVTLVQKKQSGLSILKEVYHLTEELHEIRHEAVITRKKISQSSIDQLNGQINELLSTVRDVQSFENELFFIKNLPDMINAIDNTKPSMVTLANYNKLNEGVNHFLNEIYHISMIFDLSDPDTHYLAHLLSNQYFDLIEFIAQTRDTTVLYQKGYITTKEFQEKTQEWYIVTNYLRNETANFSHIMESHEESRVLPLITTLRKFNEQLSQLESSLRNLSSTKYSRAVLTDYSRLASDMLNEGYRFSNLLTDFILDSLESEQSRTVYLFFLGFLWFTLLQIAGYYLLRQTSAKSNRMILLLQAILENRQLLNSNMSKEAIYQKLCQNLVEHTGFQVAWVGIAQNDKEKTILPVAISGDAADYVKSIKVHWGDDDPLSIGPGGLAIKHGKTQIFNNIEKDKRFSPWKEVALKFGIRSTVTIPIIPHNTPIGNLSVYSDRIHGFSSEEIELLEEMTSDLAHNIKIIESRKEQKELKHKLEIQNLIMQEASVLEQSKIAEMENAAVMGMAAIAQLKETTSGEKYENTLRVTGWLLDKLCIDKKYKKILTPVKTDEIYKASVIHDIGNTVVPDQILQKKGPLSIDELQVIKQHPAVGGEFLKGITSQMKNKGVLATAENIIRYHHERWDGCGYPEGLKGEKIPLEAQIVGIVAFYIALTTERPYRKKYTHEKAIEIIQSERGRGFNPYLTDIILEYHQEIKLLKLDPFSTRRELSESSSKFSK